MALQKTLAMLLQFLMFSLVTAAPITTESHGNSWQYGAGGGVVGFIVLILDIIVFSKFRALQFSSSSKLFSPPLGSCPTIARACTRPRANTHLVEVLKSNRPVSHKLLWCVLVFLFPIVGIVVYWLFSNREAHNSGGGYETIG